MTTSRASTVPDVTRAGERSSLVQVLRQHAQRHPDKIALRFLERGEGDGTSLTYGELDRLALAWAARLDELGARGRPVLLVYPAGLRFVVAFCACLYAGAVAVPTPFTTPARSAPRIGAIAGDALPCAVLSCATLVTNETIRAAFPAELGGVPWVVTDTDDVWDKAGPAMQAYPEPKDPAFLQYTSGSTADPRGVIVTHGNLMANMDMIRLAMDHDADIRMISWLPLFHDMGLVGGLLQPLYVGGLAVLMSPMDFIQRPTRWLQAIARYRGTTSGGPNFAFALCADRIRPDQLEGLDLSSWRVAFCGAEPVRADDLRRFAERLAPARFDPKALLPCYGMAETTLFVSGGPVGRGLACTITPIAPGRAETVERVICGDGAAGQALAIVDPETCRRLPDGQLGEIWVSGPHVGAGYWQKEDASRATFQARLADGHDDERFLRTGDLGMLRDGDLVIAGRIKDVIIVRGVKHHPEDIEATAARAHPALAGTAAAFAIEEDGADALIVLQEVARGHVGDAGLDIAAEAVSAAVCDSFGVRAAEVVLVRPGTLPRTTSNKVRRGACREAYLAGELSPLQRQTPKPRPDAAPPSQAGAAGIGRHPGSSAHRDGSNG